MPWQTAGFTSILSFYVYMTYYSFALRRIVYQNYGLAPMGEVRQTGGVKVCGAYLRRLKAKRLVQVSFRAAQAIGRAWHMKRQKLSARPTTRWDELMTVR